MLAISIVLVFNALNEQKKEMQKEYVKKIEISELRIELDIIRQTLKGIK